VNAIEQDDVIKSVTIVRKGSDAKKFNAAKVFGDYFAGKADEEKKAEEVKKAKSAAAKASTLAYLAEIRKNVTKTASGLEYKIISQGGGVKPADGSQVFINYAGYLEDGSLFDTSYKEVAEKYGKVDAGRPYGPMPATAGKYQFIPGFAEGLNAMSIGDKAVIFIPSSLGYGEKGAGNVIPPNSNIIFEVELLDKMPAKK
ncbi:MAG TPA: FKBP-type peptidyl-prolyl cis-trans isomerase, partial [Flavobacterium sp.]|nr:FKBP-type peptidyl-prolyl cis-trans isomerase [Flavobacterium sp.]